MTVSVSTAFEDARRALRCAIWQRLKRRIQGAQWVTITPGGDPPDELGCNTEAWTRVLSIAAATLRKWQYALPEPAIADGESMLDKPLNRSVRLLHDAMTAYRPTGVTTTCDHGGDA